MQYLHGAREATLRLFSRVLERHEVFVAGCFAVIALVMFSVAALPLTLVSIAALFVLAGFCSGAVAPSRDMLIRLPSSRRRSICASPSATTIREH